MTAAVRGLALAVCLAAVHTVSTAKDPDCTGPDAWPAGMAYTQLKNAGVFGDQPLDASRTTVRLLASERVGNNRFRQVHRVQFMTGAGDRFTAITVNEASRLECSLSEVDVYLVSKRLGGTADDPHKR